MKTDGESAEETHGPGAGTERGWQQEEGGRRGHGAEACCGEERGVNGKRDPDQAGFRGYVGLSRPLTRDGLCGQHGGLGGLTDRVPYQVVNLHMEVESRSQAELSEKPCSTSE